MKQILTILLLFCTLGISAQDVVVTRQKKQQTTTTKPKQNSSQKKQTAPAVKPKQQSKQTTPTRRVSASYSNGTLSVNGINYSMVYVQGGTFNMGATSEQGSDAVSAEKPVHQVSLSSYYIGKYEVTQELWQAVMGRNPSSFKGSRRPVETVSWEDCQTFISKLNTVTGKRFRLPTEAEWEFASRGGTMSRGYKYSGSNTLGNVAWYTDNSGNTTHDVGTKSPNELGICDMSGNVYEWCSDWFGNYSSSSQSNPTGAYSGSYRVFRGGSWFNLARFCRSSLRNNWTPGIRYVSLGLRLVLSEF